MQKENELFWQAKYQDTELTKKKSIIAILYAVLIVLFIWTIWGNTALEVSEYEMMSNRIPEAFSGFRIAQVSDLHNAEFGEGNKTLITMLSQTDPDIIVITGDLVFSGHAQLKPMT